MRPWPRADLEGRKCRCRARYAPTAELTVPDVGTYLQSLPIHCAGVELEALAVLGVGAGRGVALRSPAVGLPVLWGTEAQMHTPPREGSASSWRRQVGHSNALPGPCHPAARRGHLPGQQGRCRKAARCGPAADPHHILASHGRHICCGAGEDRRKGGWARDTQPSSICEPLLPMAGCAGSTAGCTPAPVHPHTHSDLAPDAVQAGDALVALDALVASVTLDRGIALDPCVLHHLQGTGGTAGTAPTDLQPSPLHCCCGSGGCCVLHRC